MNIKNKIFLGLALVLSTGLIHAMQRTDEQILNNIEEVSYEQRPYLDGTREMWYGYLSNGGDITISYLPVLDEIEYFSTPSDIASTNFKGDEGSRKALNYLKQKYNKQEESHKLTQ